MWPAVVESLVARLARVGEQLAPFLPLRNAAFGMTGKAPQNVDYLWGQQGGLAYFVGISGERTLPSLRALPISGSTVRIWSTATAPTASHTSRRIGRWRLRGAVCGCTVRVLAASMPNTLTAGR